MAIQVSCGTLYFMFRPITETETYHFLARKSILAFIHFAAIRLPTQISSSHTFFIYLLQSFTVLRSNKIWDTTGNDSN